MALTNKQVTYAKLADGSYNWDRFSVGMFINHRDGLHEVIGVHKDHKLYGDCIAVRSMIGPSLSHMIGNKQSKLLKGNPYTVEVI